MYSLQEYYGFFLKCNTWCAHIIIKSKSYKLQCMTIASFKENEHNVPWDCFVLVLLLFVLVVMCIFIAFVNRWLVIFIFLWFELLNCLIEIRSGVPHLMILVVCLLTFFLWIMNKCSFKKKNLQCMTKKEEINQIKFFSHIYLLLGLIYLVNYIIK